MEIQQKLQDYRTILGEQSYFSDPRVFLNLFLQSVTCNLFFIQMKHKLSSMHLFYSLSHLSPKLRPNKSLCMLMSTRIFVGKQLVGLLCALIAIDGSFMPTSNFIFTASHFLHVDFSVPNVFKLRCSCPLTWSFSSLFTSSEI